MSASQRTRSKTPAGALSVRLDDSGRKTQEGDAFRPTASNVPASSAKAAPSRATSQAPSLKSRPPAKRVKSVPPATVATRDSPLTEAPSSPSTPTKHTETAPESSLVGDNNPQDPVQPPRARSSSPTVEDVEDEELENARSRKSLPSSSAILMPESEAAIADSDIRKSTKSRMKTPAPDPGLVHYSSDDEEEAIPAAHPQLPQAQRPLFDPFLQDSGSESDGTEGHVGQKQSLEQMLGQRPSRLRAHRAAASAEPKASYAPSRPASRPPSRAPSRPASRPPSRAPSRPPSRAPSRPPSRSPSRPRSPPPAQSDPGADDAVSARLKEATDTINFITAPLTDILGESEEPDPKHDKSSPKSSELDYEQIMGDPDDDDDIDYDGADQMNEDGNDKPKTGFRRGKISNEHMELILAAVRLFDETLTEIARTSGKSLSYIYRLAMPHLKISRKPNLFNLFVKRWCFKNKMKEGESFPQLRERFVTAYREQVLPKSDVEKQKLRVELLEWNETYEKKDAETVQREGNLYKIMLQARLEFEVLAQYYYRFYDIATFGWCVSIAPGDINAAQANSTFASTKAAGKYMDQMGASVPAAMDTFASLVKIHKAAEISSGDWSKEKQDKLVPRGGDPVRDRATDFLKLLQRQATGRQQTYVMWAAFQKVLVERQKVVMNWPEDMPLPVGTKTLFMGSMDKLKDFVNTVFEIMRGEAPSNKIIHVRDMGKEELKHYEKGKVTAAWRGVAIWRDTKGRPLLHVRDALKVKLEGDEEDVERGADDESTPVPELSAHARQLQQREAEKEKREKQKEEKRRAREEQERLKEEKRLAKEDLAEKKRIEKVARENTKAAREAVKRGKSTQPTPEEEEERARLKKLEALKKKQSVGPGALPKSHPPRPRPDYVDTDLVPLKRKRKRGDSASSSSSSSSSPSTSSARGSGRRPPSLHQPSPTPDLGTTAPFQDTYSSGQPRFPPRNQQLGGGAQVPGPDAPLKPSAHSEGSSLAGALDVPRASTTTLNSGAPSRPVSHPARAAASTDSSLAGALGSPPRPAAASRSGAPGGVQSSRSYAAGVMRSTSARPQGVPMELDQPPKALATFAQLDTQSLHGPLNDDVMQWDATPPVTASKTQQSYPVAQPREAPHYAPANAYLAPAAPALAPGARPRVHAAPVARPLQPVGPPRRGAPSVTGAPHTQRFVPPPAPALGAHTFSASRSHLQAPQLRRTVAQVPRPGPGIRPSAVPPHLAAQHVPRADAEVHKLREQIDLMQQRYDLLAQASSSSSSHVGYAPAAQSADMDTGPYTQDYRAQQSYDVQGLYDERAYAEQDFTAEPSYDDQGLHDEGTYAAQDFVAQPTYAAQDYDGQDYSEPYSAQGYEQETYVDGSGVSYTQGGASAAGTEYDSTSYAWGTG